MPCYDPRDSSPAAISAEARAQAMIDFTHNSPVAEMLCSVMKAIHPADQEQLCGRIPGLCNWWEEHKKRDAVKGGV